MAPRSWRCRWSRLLPVRRGCRERTRHMSDTQQSSQLLNVEALRYGVASAQATAVLAASVHAAEAEAFRQLIWRRLAIAAAIWLLLGVARVVPPIGLAFGLAIFGAVAA